MLKIILIEVDCIQLFESKRTGFHKGSYSRDLSDLGRNEDAINSYSKALEIDPQYAEAYFARVRYYFQYLSGN